MPQPGDDKLLARLMFAEAAGVQDSYPAVGWTIVDRVGDPKFAKNLPAVVYKPKQFTSVGGDPWGKAGDPSTLDPANAASYARALDVANGILSGKIANPTDYATFFYSGSTPPPGFFQEGIKSGRLAGAGLDP